VRGSLFERKLDYGGMGTGLSRPRAEKNDPIA